MMAGLGGVVAAVGLLALYFDTVLAGGLAIAVGSFLGLAGMVGAFWNDN
ncbi:hypothetical protein [Noviherbaspirillum sp. ST9]